MAKKVLIERGDTCVWIEMKDGNLAISGQTLRGSSEYEYLITVEPKDFATIRKALGGTDCDDVIELITTNREAMYSQGEATWLESLGIKYGFSNYFDGGFFEMVQSNAEQKRGGYSGGRPASTLGRPAKTPSGAVKASTGAKPKTVGK